MEPYDGRDSLNRTNDEMHWRRRVAGIVLSFEMVVERATQPLHATTGDRAAARASGEYDHSGRSGPVPPGCIRASVIGFPPTWCGDHGGMRDRARKAAAAALSLQKGSGYLVTDAYMEDCGQRVHGGASSLRHILPGGGL